MRKWLLIGVVTVLLCGCRKSGIEVNPGVTQIADVQAIEER